MKNFRRSNKKRISFILALCFIALIGWPLLVQAGPTLPPRNPPPTAPPPAQDQGDDDDGLPLGSYIELQTSGSSWAVVQWQDNAGGWHDVEGWNGALSSGYQRWWVAAKDFNTGPFRWVVKQGPNGAVVGTSDMFTLPSGASAGVLISVP